MNYQHLDVTNLLNDAKFSDNGGCGYVLKPDFMRRPDPDYSPLIIPNSISIRPKSLEITIISGQHIPRPGGGTEGSVIKPFVRVKINGHPAENENNQNDCNTDYVEKNGFNPFWNKSFQLSVKVPELAFLELSVKDKRSLTKIGEKMGKDVTIGTFVCPFNMLCQGISYK